MFPQDRPRPPGASILFGNRFDEDEEEKRRREAQAPPPQGAQTGHSIVEEQGSKPRPSGASILFGDRFEVPEQGAPPPLQEEPQGPPAPGSMGLSHNRLPRFGTGEPGNWGSSFMPRAPQGMIDQIQPNPNAIKQMMGTDPEEVYNEKMRGGGYDTEPPIPPASLMDGGYADLYTMDMLPGAPRVRHPVEEEEPDPIMQNVPLPTQERSSRFEYDQARPAPPDSIGRSSLDPLSFQREAEHQAGQEIVDDHGPLERFSRSMIAQKRGTPIGTLATLHNKLIPEEHLRASAEYLGYDRGIAGAVGRTVGFIGQPVLEIMMTKGIAASLAPILRGLGATKTSQFLEIVGTQPGEFLANKQYGRVLTSLIGEELSFVAGDVIQGIDAPHIGFNALMGLGAGFGIEGVGAYLRMNKAQSAVARRALEHEANISRIREAVPEGSVKPREAPDVPQPKSQQDETVRVAGEDTTPQVPEVDRRSAPREGQADRDRTAQRLRAERARRVEAEKNAVTGMSGRGMFDRAAARLDPEKGDVVGLFDITNFKPINDNVGYSSGDAVLKHAGETIRQAARELGVTDRFLYHFGGDEFAVTGRDAAQVQAVLGRAAELFGTMRVGEYEITLRGALGPDFDSANVALKGVKEAETGVKARDTRAMGPYDLGPVGKGTVGEPKPEPKSKPESGEAEAEPELDHQGDSLPKGVRVVHDDRGRMLYEVAEWAPDENVFMPAHYTPKEWVAEKARRAASDKEYADRLAKVEAAQEAEVRDAGPVFYRKLPEAERPGVNRAIAEIDKFSKTGLAADQVVKDFARMNTTAFDAYAEGLGLPRELVEKMRSSKEVIAARGGGPNVERTKFGKEVRKEIADALDAARKVDSQRPVRPEAPEPKPKPKEDESFLEAERLREERTGVPGEGSSLLHELPPPDLPKPKPKPKKPKGKTTKKGNPTEPEEVKQAVKEDPKAVEALVNDPEAGFFDLGGISRDISAGPVGKFARKWFGTAGDMDRELFEAKLAADARLKARLNRANRTVDAIQDKLKRDFGIEHGQVTDQRMIDALNEVLTPKTPRHTNGMALSDDLIKDLRHLRKQIDFISKRMLESGYIQGDLSVTITQGLGTWMTRSYRQFQPGRIHVAGNEEMASAMNWAMSHFGASYEEARNLVSKLMSAGSVKDGWGQVRSAARVFGSAEGRVMKPRSGFVPTHMRVDLHKRLGKKDLDLGDLNKMIDDFIAHDTDGKELFDLIGDRVNFLSEKLRKIPLEELSGKQGKAISINLDKLMHMTQDLKARREIPDELRKLWGEETNPLVNAMMSIQGAARQLEDHRFAEDLVRRGMDAGYVRTGSEGVLNPETGKVERIRSPEEWMPLTPETQRRMGWMGTIEDWSFTGGEPTVKKTPQDLFIHRDIVEAIEHRFLAGNTEMISTFGQAVRLATWAVKGNMTFRSVSTHFRNFLGASYFQVLNGHIGIHNVLRHTAGTAKAEPGTLTHAFMAAREGLRTKVFGTSEEWAKLMDRYTHLGIVDSSIRARQFQENMREILGGTDDIREWMRRRETKLARMLDNTKAVDKIIEFDQLAQDMYRMEDDIAKIFMFENELASMDHWWDKAGDVDLKRPSRKEMEKEAARLTNDLYPNYDRLPRIIQDLRKNPLISSFPSFAWEVLRTGKNHMLRTVYELQHPVLWRRGFARAMGGAQVMAAVPAAAAMLRNLHGISREEMDAFQRSRGVYQLNNQLLIVGKNKDGTYNYIDLSYTDPGDIWRTAIQALAMDRKENPGKLWQSLAKGFAASSEPFRSEEIILGAFIDLWRKTDVFGRPVSKKEGGKGSLKHVWNIVRPGTLRAADRLVQAFTEKVQPNYTTLSKAGEVLGVFGVRMERANPRADTYWRMGRWRGDLVKSEAVLNRMVESLNNDVSDRELIQAYQQLEADRRELFRHGTLMVEDAQWMGMDMEDVLAMAKNMNLPKRDIEALLAGMYVPKEFGSTYKQQVIEASGMKDPAGRVAPDVMNRIEHRVALLRRATDAVSNRREFFR